MVSAPGGPTAKEIGMESQCSQEAKLGARRRAQRRFDRMIASYAFREIRA